MNAQMKRVLLIEDNPGDVDLIRLSLVEIGSDRGVSYDVVCADRLSTGLAAMAKERPAVVLLDLYLPDSMGADTFRNVLHQASGVAVVVLTGRDDEELVVNAVQHGVQDYLVKGCFNSRQLARTLRCAMERQALLTALRSNCTEQAQFEEHLLSLVSDELLTPLAAIHELVTVLLGDVATPVTAQHRKHLNNISRKAGGLYSRIDNLLAMRTPPDKSRTETVEPHSYRQSAES